MGACFSCSQAVSAVDADGSGGGSNPSSMPSSRGMASISWKERSMRKKREEKIGEWGGSDRLSDVVSGGEGSYEDELHRVPGRMFLNSASEVACLFTQQGKKGTNQDAMLVWENFSSRNDTIFCGVFDGHGPLGHFVSKKVRDSLPLKLYSHWRGNLTSKDIPHENGFMPRNINSAKTAFISIEDEHCATLEVDDSENLPEMYLTLKQSLLNAFKLMDEELKLNPTIDCFCSGTTAVTVIKQGRNLVIGNVGDSRAILGTRDENNSMVAVQLTVDLKPNLPREAARIQRCRGRVFSLQDEPDVARVWLPDNDSPGLAMARAFGDFCLKDYGLISVPDISYHYLSEKDEFIVLATDGIWDVLSNREVVDIVASAPSRGTAARALVDCAVRTWKLKFPTSKIDDCAVVCLFLDIPKSPSHVTKNDLKETSKSHSTGVDVQQMDTPSKLENQVAIVNEIHDSVPCSAQVSPRLSNTFFDANEIEQVSDELNGDRMTVKSQSPRSLSKCISTAEEEECSSLQGVSRVNSLVSLPRFSSSLSRSSSRR